MKQLIVTFIIICAGTTIYAQKKDSSYAHFELSLNGGIASPSGNFAKGEYSDERSGFAKTGFHYNISGVYYLNRNFGIGALVGYSQFGHKGSQSLSDGYKEDSGTDSTTLLTKGNNRSLSFLVGPYYSFHLSNHFSIGLHVLGGYVNSNLSGFDVYYEDYTDNVMTQKESSAGAFGFQAGAGIKYKITSKIGVQAGVDYFASKPAFDINYENFNVNSGRRLTTYNESIAGLNTSIGIIFGF
ncbi:MAG: outer membrane beta-barrel protein [Agriterribacter sp.]